MSKTKKEEEKNVAYAYNWMLFGQEREGNSAICNKSDGPWGHYAKWRKSDKDKYCMVSLVCVIHEAELLNKEKNYSWQGLKSGRMEGTLSMGQKL